VVKGRRRVRGRVLDVSAGGLCIVAPVRFQHKMTVEVVIDDPRHGPVQVEAIIRHERRFRQPSSGRKGWATGMVLSKGGPDFQALSGARVSEPTRVGAAPQSQPASRAPESMLPSSAQPSLEVDDELALELDETSVYRVKVKAVGKPRIRSVTLSAASEADVRASVEAELEGDWEVLSIEADPLD
jgi:hypothetical protein